MLPRIVTGAAAQPTLHPETASSTQLRQRLDPFVTLVVQFHIDAAALVRFRRTLERNRCDAQSCGGGCSEIEFPAHRGRIAVRLTCQVGHLPVRFDFAQNVVMLMDASTPIGIRLQHLRLVGLRRRRRQKPFVFVGRCRVANVQLLVVDFLGSGPENEQLRGETDGYETDSNRNAYRI